jgi:nucleotide-binding universal stress UspA family protein
MNGQTCLIKKIENLLLSTDGSDFSDGAVREAISLAKTCSGKLFAISVVETNPEYETLAPQLVEKEIEKAQSYLEIVKEKAAKENVTCETIVRQGEDSYRYVVEEAEKKNVEMIVMGRRGRTGLKRLMMGSVTAKVIGHSPCNVLVVPRASRVELKNILVATDGSRHSEAAAIEAIGIARRGGAKLTVISVVPSEAASPFDIVHSEMQRDMITEKEQKAAECNIRNIRDIAEKEGIAFEGLVREGKPYEAIIAAAGEKNIDLIVVGSHGRTGLEKLLMGSVTERVIGLSPCAILVVKAK